MHTHGSQTLGQVIHVGMYIYTFSNKVESLLSVADSCQTNSTGNLFYISPPQTFPESNPSDVMANDTPSSGIAQCLQFREPVPASHLILNLHLFPVPNSEVYFICIQNATCGFSSVCRNILKAKTVFPKLNSFYLSQSLPDRDSPNHRPPPAAPQAVPIQLQGDQTHLHLSDSWCSRNICLTFAGKQFMKHHFVFKNVSLTFFSPTLFGFLQNIEPWK